MLPLLLRMWGNSKCPVDEYFGEYPRKFLFDASLLRMMGLLDCSAAVGSSRADSVLEVSSDKMAVNVPSGINDQSPTIALF
jgi:hypothetical protein